MPTIPPRDATQNCVAARNAARATAIVEERRHVSHAGIVLRLVDPEDLVDAKRGVKPSRDGDHETGGQEDALEEQGPLAPVGDPDGRCERHEVGRAPNHLDARGDGV
jgi:hypothetical protein